MQRLKLKHGGGSSGSTWLSCVNYLHSKLKLGESSALSRYLQKLGLNRKKKPGTVAKQDRKSPKIKRGILGKNQRDPT
jgi:hypothetical protein